ncbi:MAG: PD-(D/E)XK nuclease family protein [Melioribacteraceae bacterium]|nr:PD-(D/E)XK nuclease family protein [Melioribacteraceae bacterium]
MILTKEKIESISIDEILNERIKNNQFTKFLLIVPTNRKLRALKKEIISFASNQVVTGLNLETLTTVSNKLLGVSNQYHELSDEAATIFIEQSVKSVDLQYFNNYNGNIPSGTLDRIKNIISKYKEEGITPELLFEESEKLERSEKKKAIDIAKIYKVYLEKCKELNALELGDIYATLINIGAAELDNSFSELFRSVELIVLTGFDAFTALEISIINKLASLDNKKLFLSFDYYSYNSMIFSHLDETYSRFQKYGFVKVEEKSPVNPNSFIELVRRRLFLKTEETICDKFKNNIIKISAPSREKEVELIAKEIKTLLLSKKVLPHEISVTFNLINNYSPVVRDTFTRYGIPFNLTDRLKLDSSLSVIAIISFLEILESDYYYKYIIRAFSNSLLDVTDVNINSIIFTASRLNIVVGKRGWRDSINNGVTFKERREGLGKSTKTITHYKNTLKSLDIIDDLLAPFINELRPLEFFKELNNLIHKLNIPNNILSSGITNKENEIKSLTTFLVSSKEIFGLIENEKKAKSTFTLSFYLEKLFTLSSSTRFNIKERSNYGVLVTNIDELRGLIFKYSFLGGLIDGDFPTRYRPEIFFSGSFAKRDKEHLNSERFRFYQSLSSWSKGLYLTLPNSEGEKDSAESTFLKDFEKIFTVTKRGVEDYQHLIYSNEEAQRNVPIDSLMFISDETKVEWKSLSQEDDFRNNNPHEHSSYSGFILNDDESLFNDSDSLERPYSISQLETYKKCPFRYFLERVLKIEVADEPDEEIEAVEIGSLLHSIMYDFYSEIMKRNIKLHNCSDAVFKVAEDIIFDIAEKHSDLILKDSPFAFYEKEKLFGLNGKREHSILYQFILTERNDTSGRIPKYFEANFGVEDVEQDSSISVSTPLMLDDIELRGKIDRIDVNNNDNTFEVIDYKSGSKTITKAEIIEGLSLQLPIYIWAAKELLLNNTEVKFKPQAMTIYSLKFQKNIFGKNPVYLGRGSNVDYSEIIDEYVEIALEHVKAAVYSIRKGEFPITPFLDNRDKVCRFCNYNMICRVDGIGNK